MNQTITLAGRAIGGIAPCLVIAEAGVNHNGDPELAAKLIDVAADAKADVVKFQTFDADALAGPTAAKAEYQARAVGGEGNQLQMLRSLTLPLDAYERLIAHARRRGILFLSTPFDPHSADFLERLDLPAFKISSGDLDNTPFLTHVAKKKRPMLVSTGMGTMSEVAVAVATVQRAGAPLALFHCVSNYPTDPADCNLHALRTMRVAFDVPVGWSDHTMGIDVATASIALGAKLLEKHITLDRTMSGPDHKASLEPTELNELVCAVRRVEAALGDGHKVPRPSEAGVARVARRSLHWARSLPVDHIVTAADVIVLRPAEGIAPSALEWIIGRRVGRAVEGGSPMVAADLA